MKKIIISPKKIKPPKKIVKKLPKRKQNRPPVALSERARKRRSIGAVCGAEDEEKGGKYDKMAAPVLRFTGRSAAKELWKKG